MAFYAQEDCQLLTDFGHEEAREKKIGIQFGNLSIAEIAFSSVRPILEDWAPSGQWIVFLLSVLGPPLVHLFASSDFYNFLVLL